MNAKRLNFLAAVCILSFTAILSPACRQPKRVQKKPVIYLYPETEMEVRVKLNLNSEFELTVTEPFYENGWSVLAKPDGQLTNLSDGKTYPYLFWETNSGYEFRFEKGFCVMRDSTESFLRRTLTAIGLNENEREEFISFWAPEMKMNECNLISFAGEEFTSRAQLDIQPKPDALLRVFMIFKSTAPGTEIEPQSFGTFERKGFAVVEWGGTNMDVPADLN